MKNDLGIFSWFGFFEPLGKRLGDIKKANFDSTILWWEDEQDFTGKVVLKKELMPEMVRNEGLLLENMHTPYYNCNNLWCESTSKRKAVIDEHFSWLEDCARYDIPAMVIHLTDGDNIPDPNALLLKSLEVVIDYAEELKVVVAVENTRRFDYVDHVFNNLASPFLKFCYDSGHDWLHDCQGRQESCGELLVRWSHLLHNTHLADNDTITDHHWLPGEGSVDWQKISAEFPKDYQGVLNLEVVKNSNKQDEATSELFLQKAYAAAKKFQDLIQEQK